ncbi:MAG TPA: ATP phosphoribosyltransferase regulatory subunit, partial [Candidatus Hydrogenedentes bacterium]|nr:ATP phosphoribosyltransferase regulatory subunit [Candidatus Hydrogenedentota bacterium]
LEALGLSDEEVCYDPSLTRGLDYYTGPVLEVALPGAPEFGSVGGGGRYDGLCDRFLEEPIPATGASIGLDRLVAALVHLGLAPASDRPIHACVVTVGNVPWEEVLRLAAELRAGGLNIITFPGAKKGLGAQLSLADHYGIPAAVVLGEDELARGVVAVKDLAMGKAIRENIADHDAYRRAGREAQVTVPRNEAAERIRRITGA